MDRKRKRNNWASQRKFKSKNQKNKDKSEKPVDDGHYETFRYPTNSSKFNLYYAHQLRSLIKSEDEMKEFLRVLKERLPVTFRINPLNPLAPELVQKFVNSKAFFETFMNAAVNEDGDVEPKQTKRRKLNDGGEEDIEAEDVQKGSDDEEFYERPDYNKNLSKEELKIDQKNFYPGGLVFEMSIPRQVLKKNPGLKQAHTFI